MARKRRSSQSIVKVYGKSNPAFRSPNFPEKPASTRTRRPWKKKYGSLGTPEIRGLNELRDEYTRLKRLVADLALDKVFTARRALKKA